MKAQILKNGGYFSKATGKVLSRYADIDGDIIDANGNVVLSLEEFKGGLVDRFGVNIDVRNALGLGASYLMEGTKKVFNAGLDVAKWGWKQMKRGAGILGKGVDEVRKWFDDSEMPEWAKGMFGPDSPFLEAIYSLQMPNLEMLIGETMGDRYSQVLLDQLQVQTKIYEFLSGGTMEFDRPDAEPVLVGVDGQPLLPSSPDTALRERLKAGVDQAKDVVGTQIGRVSGGLSEHANVSERVESLFDGMKSMKPSFGDKPEMGDEGPVGTEIVTGDDIVSDASTKAYMSAQLHALRKLAEPDEVAGDGDGDGYRDGSWQERAARKRNEVRDEVVEALAPSSEKDEKGGGILGALLGGIGGLGGTMMDGFSMLRDVLLAKAGASALDSAGDLIGGDGLDGPDGKDGKWKPGGKKVGRLGRMMEGAKRMMRPGLSLGARALPAIASSAAAIPGVASTASAVGGAISAGAAAVAAAPAGVVLAGAAAVAGIGYGGYKLFKYFERNSEVEPLEGLRYLQYGVHLKDKHFIARIRELEDEVIDAVNISSSEVRVTKQPIEFFEEFGADMGMSMESDADSVEWVTWFSKRFMPVFLTHLQVAYKLDDGVDLLDIDDEMDDDLKMEFIRRVQFTEADRQKGLAPYDWAASPMKGATLIANAGAVIGEYVRRLVQGIKLDTLDEFDVLPKEVKANEDLTMSLAMERELAQSKEQSKALSGAERLRGGMQQKKPAAVPVADVKKGAGTETKKPTPTVGKLEWPAEGVISSEFGPRVHPITKRNKPHKGIDIAAPTGSPVYAATDGEIYRQYYSKSYGKVIYLRHDDGTSSRYAHLHGYAPGTGVGKRVERGAVIGYVGNTGASAGPHLHFEYREDTDQYGRALDPMAHFESAQSVAARKAKEEAKRAIKDEETAAGEVPIEGHNTLADGRVQETTTYKVNGMEVDRETYENHKAAQDNFFNDTDSNVVASNNPSPPATLTSSESPDTAFAPAAVPVVNVNPVTDSPLMDRMLQENTVANRGAAEQRAEQIQVQRELNNKLDRIIEAGLLGKATDTVAPAKPADNVGPTRSTTSQRATPVEQPPRAVAAFVS